MSVAPVPAKPPASTAPDHRGTLGMTSNKQSVTRPSAASGSFLQRPTGASVAMLPKGRKKPPKELTFKQQLLKKTMKESALRPSGVLALHIKHGHFHDIDSGGMSRSLTGSFIRFWL